MQSWPRAGPPNFWGKVELDPCSSIVIGRQRQAQRIGKARSRQASPETGILLGWLDLAGALIDVGIENRLTYRAFPPISSNFGHPNEETHHPKTNNEYAPSMASGEYGQGA